MIIWIVLFSSSITLVLTALQLWNLYQRELDQIEVRLQEVEHIHSQSLVEALEAQDLALLNTRLQKLLGLPDMESLQVTMTGQVIASAGQASGSDVRTRLIPLPVEQTQTNAAPVVLRVSASLEGVYEQVWSSLWRTLAGNGLKTLLVAGFMVLLFQRLIMRHLDDFADFTRDWQAAEGVGRVFMLDRRYSSQRDELDSMVSAFTDMQYKLVQLFNSLSIDETRLREIIDHLPSLVWILDRRHRCQFTSQSWQQFVATEHADLPDWLDVIHPQDRAGLLQLLQQQENSPSRFSQECRLSHADQQYRWVHLHAGPLLDDNQQVYGWLFCGFDIHDRQARLQELERQNKQLKETVSQRTTELVDATEKAIGADSERTEFMGRLSFELRTPLNAIIGFTQILLSDEQLNDQQRPMLEEVEAGGNRLLQLLEELLELHQLEAAQGKLQLTAVSLEWVIEDAEAAAAEAMGRRDITLQIDAQQASDQVMAEAVRLRQVLLNLLLHSIDLSPDGSTLTLQIVRDEDQVLLQLEDAGPTMDESQRQRAFEPFAPRLSQGHEMFSTGIGLSIARHLVVHMHGRIDILPGKVRGNIYQVRLPSAQ